MNILYFIIPALLMILLSIYLYYYIARALRRVKVDVKKNQVKLIIISLVLIIMYFSLRDLGIGIVVLLHIVVLALVMDLLNYIFKILSKRNTIAFNKWRTVYESGIVPIILTAIILAYGYWNMNDIVEKDYKIYTNKNIRDEGYRVAMISDLHYGTVMNREKLQAVCNDIEEAEPDIVVLCGDIVDEKTTVEQMKEATEILGDIKSKYGVFYIYGNHDDARYSSIPSYTKDELKNELLSNNIHVLVDERYEINDDFVIVGRDDEGFSKEEGRKSSEDLIASIDKSKFILLLDHQPSELNLNSSLGYDLQLSGHTHKGQIWPAGLISELFNFNELEYGYKKIGDYEIIVSSGISGWNYPIRTGSKSEYLIIDIEKQS
ncbi:metallophosphoesterase [Clostridium sp. NSJ-145]|uniref:metallophosphoesterase n=1 Tax=Clostridium sp. NSJ-145 TaxID=2897777 RepID=UPI001E30475F|nr:metallophosphoesterase [Clostridium sp. NSJ-145]MCD2501076.1 metallophosphoesterase [Clostridium sp. NSJ-145]